MISMHTDDDIRAALKDCEAEPVHIPGVVQPFGCLVAVDKVTGVVTYASENVEAFTGLAPKDMLGREAQDMFEHELWHGVKNAIARSSGEPTNIQVGDFNLGEIPVTLHTFESDGHVILEFEFPRDAGFSGIESMRTLTFLIKSVESCKTEQELFDITVRLTRMLSGYDRVMIYKYDRDWNGEVMAEDLRRRLEPFLGLRFPHWDIPAQARAIMEKVPIRFIFDVDQTPVPLLSRDKKAPPLDITLGYTRGVSEVHLEYLRNMGSKATLTLSLIVDGTLWGILSFHHQRPHIPPPGLREILVNFGQVFATKLEVLRQKRRLDQVAAVDQLKDRLLSEIGDKDEFEGFAASVLEIMGADGMVLDLGGRLQSYGHVPDGPMVEHLQKLARAADGPLMYERLGDTFPNLTNSANGCAGALLLKSQPNRTLAVFRRERARDVSWAGNPGKTIEDNDGRKRLAPRGSFSTYLELVHGAADPWTEQDIYFASRIWVLVNSVERRELINSLSRQQQIMIGELNHRVRNILALVRSVSTQARRSSYGSINSYARSLEARIQALAASHDLASGSVVATVPLSELIEKEFEPFVMPDVTRHSVTGVSKALRADLAPIFSLVIHELVTNAVKYGALSNSTGTVNVALEQDADGLSITWQEIGGPQAIQPSEFGFGTTLIRQAIPHEMQGKTSLTFKDAGVEAHLFLPANNFEDAVIATVEDPRPFDTKPAERQKLKLAIAKTTCLVVEDNFVIAEGLRGQLDDLGVREVEIVSNVRDALDVIEDDAPSFAVLDINLGGGKTSTPVAKRLTAMGVPFFFVTGYGEATDQNLGFEDALRLTKPAATEELLGAIAKVLKLKGASGS
ncbi:MAG: HWE histidine kinase domain-containing protein [Pseudomonadota bacterium]